MKTWSERQGIREEGNTLNTTELNTCKIPIKMSEKPYIIKHLNKHGVLGPNGLFFGDWGKAQKLF